MNQIVNETKASLGVAKNLTKRLANNQKAKGPKFGPGNFS